jgi:hypothetical protein
MKGTIMKHNKLLLEKLPSGILSKSSISTQKERTSITLTVRSGLRAGCNSSDGNTGSADYGNSGLSRIIYF